MKPNPTVSVCIPVYNGADYLNVAIDSVLRQTYDDFELIIMDNCSTDESFEIARGFESQRVRVSRNRENLGMAGNWTRCLAAARGKYVKILPADDFLYPDCLARQVAVFAAAGSEDPGRPLGIVACARDVVNDTGSRKFSMRFSQSGRRHGLAMIRNNVRRGINTLGPPGNVLFRTDLARAAGAFQDEYLFVVDLAFYFKVLLKSDVVMQPEVLTAFRVGTGSCTRQLAWKQAASFVGYVKAIRRDPVYGLSRFDLAACRCMATLNMIGRLLLTRFLLK
ncbi:MAG: glycosyltransferase family 2 protein [Lentisphaeria bacterium]|nr:glycosyltransferase family 2 protein [Lentisphaeria bacterium]